MLELDCECSGTGMGLAQSSSLIAESDILFRLFLSVCLNAFVTEIKKKKILGKWNGKRNKSSWLESIIEDNLA